jgi:hypothetical protein
MVRLARRWLPVPTAHAGGPKDVLAYRLVAWSGCSMLLLRVLGAQAMRGRVLGLTHPEVEGVPPPAAPPPPGAVVRLLEDMVRGGQRDCAVAFGWVVLLGEPPGGKAVVHGGYLGALVEADETLGAGGGGRPDLALRVVRWMVEGRWPTDRLRLFLSRCGEYALDETVRLLLESGRSSEALYCSWVRGGGEAVEAAVRELAAGGGMVLQAEDVAWLCAQGAGRALLAGGGAALWEGMPADLQLRLVLTEDALALLPDQHEWLLRALPGLAPDAAATAALRIATWLHLGDAPPPEGLVTHG